MVHIVSPFMTHFDKVINELLNSVGPITSKTVYGGPPIDGWKNDINKSGGQFVEVGSHAVYAAIVATNGDLDRVLNTEIEIDPTVGHDVFVNGVQINDLSNHFIDSGTHFINCLKNDLEFKVNRRLAFETAKKVLSVSSVVGEFKHPA